jgi:hypothetical protein
MSKIFVELSEQDIQIKLDELLGKRISEITDKFIEDKVEVVIDKKIERLDLDKIMLKAAIRLLTEQFGHPGQYNGKYNAMLREEACKILNDKLKHNALIQ